MNSEPQAKHILFITSSRIGDAVLSLGLLDYLEKKYPEAEFTIACGGLVTLFFEGVPRVRAVIPLKKQKYHKHWFDLWWQIRSIKFDIVVDLRDTIVSRVVYSKNRYIFTNSIEKNDHKVLQNARVMKLSSAPSPRLWFSQKQLERAEKLIPEGEGKILAVAPSANWIGKTWPVERFVEIVQWLTADDGLMPGARVAVFAAPSEEENARIVLDSVPEGRKIDVIAKADPATAAAAIARCDYFIGNDSGLMHCAAAAGVTTLGLFGASYPHIYGPWGKHTAYVSTPESFDQLKNFEGYDPKTCGCLMGSLTVDMVKEAIQKSLNLE